jgi:molybdate transport system substrate-binding protein
MYRALSLAAGVLLYAATVTNHANAAEIKVLSPGATEGAFSVLLPQFEKASGHKVTIKYGPVDALANRVRKGEAADVAIWSEPAAEELRKQEKLVAGSEVVVAKVGIGVFVRKGDPKPDISSVDAFLRSLAAAKSIAYANPALGGSTSILVGNLMNSLDTSGSIKAKTKLVAPAKPLLDLIAGAVRISALIRSARSCRTRGSNSWGRFLRQFKSTHDMSPVWLRLASSRMLPKLCSHFLLRLRQWRS